jgi:hypothetical protein
MALGRLPTVAGFAPSPLTVRVAARPAEEAAVQAERRQVAEHPRNAPAWSRVAGLPSCRRRHTRRPLTASRTPVTDSCIS